MNAYERLQRKASKLVNKLQNDISSGRKQIVENYGQKEISKFQDKEISAGNFSYQEECNIKTILFKVSSIC